MRDIGLHLRLTDTIAAAADKAAALQLPIFQCFFLRHDTLRFIEPTRDQVSQFAIIRGAFKELFVHASYWTNFSSVHDISLRTFRRELRLAKQFGFNHIIIHPGSAKGAADRQQGIDALVRRLNRLLKYEQEINIVLENTAHGKLSIGGDLGDFKAILEKCDYPDKISFCIDTAHAHVYGYAIADLHDQQIFFKELTDTIGFERIALIHLNNTNQAVGSCIDRHVLLKQGVLSTDALKNFVLHEQLKEVPIIMELPVVDEPTEKETIELVRHWHQ